MTKILKVILLGFLENLWPMQTVMKTNLLILIQMEVRQTPIVCFVSLKELNSRLPGLTEHVIHV